MKLLLLCILPVALCAPSNPYAAEKKRFLESLGLDLNSVFQLDTLKCDIQLMLDVVGADPTEQACESECHKLLQEGHVLNNGCPLVCHGFQNLVHLWHVVPDTSDPAASKCHYHPTTTVSS